MGIRKVLEVMIDEGLANSDVGEKLVPQNRRFDCLNEESVRSSPRSNNS